MTVKHLKLTQKKLAVVDNIVWPFISSMKWHAQRNYRTWYAVRHVSKKYSANNKRSLVQLHQFIWYLLHNRPVCAGMELDHINGNGLDNRLCNLREITHSQNSMNRRMHANNTSGIPGIRWCERDKEWQAHICVNGKQFNLGYFKYKPDAIAARRNAEKKYFGQFAASLISAINCTY